MKAFRTLLQCVTSKTRFVQSNCLSTVFTPREPHTPQFLEEHPPRTKVNAATVEQLERLALVDFGTEEAIKIVEDAIEFASQLSAVDTQGVEPLYTVLENRSLPLREDEVNEGGDRDLILSNAQLTEEHYFVAPPGNIPLEPKSYKFFDRGEQKS